MGVPKRKPSLARRGKRRAHQALSRPGLTACPRCKSVKLPHRVCPTCGFYGGQARVEVEPAS